MELHTYEGLDELAGELRAHATNIAYVTLTQRGVTIGENLGTVDRPMGRLDWTQRHVTDLGLITADMEVVEAADLVEPVIEWLRAKTRAATPFGRNRFRVRAYLTKGAQVLVDASIATAAEDEDLETAPARTVDVDDLIRTEHAVSVREILQLTRETLQITNRAHNDTVRHYRMITEDQRDANKAVIAQNDRLTTALVERQKAEIDARERVLAQKERRLTELETQGEAWDRMERVADKALGLAQIPEKVRELLPLLSTGDLADFLSDDDVRSMLANPEARRELLPLLRGLAKPEAQADGAPDNTQTS